MNSPFKRIIFVLAFLLLANGHFSSAMADEDDNEDRGEHQSRQRKNSEENDHGSDHGNLGIVNNPTYVENCGACHFAYQPGLLPSGSWKKLLGGLSDHFGEAVELDPESKTVISEYLRTNAAESSSAETSRKIKKSIGNQTPLQITEISYIRNKHKEIKPEVLKRKSIGSLSNCAACHIGAERGDYDDDTVKIPN
ncbi:MAG: hypothetical protein FP816_18875 [Desulfobacteraceae bacterium]|nr:hypothetical protein [Desulfobacteraceae bacterium]MBU3948591.1 diheme cytochrome c [Pseudomonadota bacterium]